MDLATPIDMAAGSAHRSAIVHVGAVRIEVLTPSLLRLEYSPTQHFENDPTVNALNRRMPVPAYSSSTSGGWLTVRTTNATLRYKLGSGPFTTLNTSLQLLVGGRRTTVAPTWEWECTFGQVCQAGAATLSGGAALSQTFPGYESTAGYAGFFVKPGASVTWHVIGSTAGPAVLSLRYYNVASPPLAPAPSTLDLDVNGRFRQVIDAAPTTAAEPWAAFTTTVPLVSGTNSIKVVSTTPNSFDLGLDTLAVGPGGCTASRSRIDRTSRRMAPRVRHRYLQRCTDLRAGTVRCHLPSGNSASQHRRAARYGWLAPARRHPERVVDSERMDRAPALVRRCRGRIPVRLRRRLQRGAAHPGRAHRSRSPAAAKRLRRVVLRLHALFEQHDRNTRSIPSSSPITCPSTPSRSTPTGRRRTIGTAGNGTVRSFPLPRPSSTGRVPTGST